MVLIRVLVAGIAAGFALLATLPVVILGAPFWIVSGLTRTIRAAIHRGQPREVEWSDLIEFTPEIGWKNRGGVRARVRQKRSFQVTTDAEGWRGSGTIDAADLVVFGDSFAFGHGVDDRHFFADRASGVRMKALGVDGYNMVHTLLWMERLKHRFKGKPVVWFAFYGNDLMDNLHPNFQHYRTPFVRSGPDDGGWKIVTEHVSSEPFPFDPRWGYRNKIAEICTPSFQSDRAYGALGFLIDRALTVCASVNSPLAVVGIPDVEMLRPQGRRRLKRKSSNPQSFDPGLPDRRVAEICTSRGIPFLPLSEIVGVDDHLPNDCHWTPRGHRKVARALERFHDDVLRGRSPQRPPLSDRGRTAVAADSRFPTPTSEVSHDA